MGKDISSDSSSENVWSITLTGLQGDGSLKSVGGAHGVSPYCYYGDSSCVPFYRSGRESHYPQMEITETSILHLA